MLSSTCHYCSPQALIFQKYIVYSNVFRYICYDSSPFLLFSLSLSLFIDRYLSCIFGTQGQMYPDNIYFLRFFCIIYLYEINKSPVFFFGISALILSSPTIQSGEIVFSPLFLLCGINKFDREEGRQMRSGGSFQQILCAYRRRGA